MNIDRRALGKTWAGWHRRLAALCGAWLVVLGLTGVAINRAHDWGLDRALLNPVAARYLYGFEQEGTSDCSTVIEPDPCERKALSIETPAGALRLTPDELMVVDAAGTVLEQLPVAVLGLVRLEAVAQRGDAVFLRGGETWVLTDPGLLNPEIVDGNDPRLPSEGAWVPLLSGAQGITWERVLLDVHAARFFGPMGPIFTDAMAILLCLLALSGAWLWWLRRGV